jgi:hypothetical protein
MLISKASFFFITKLIPELQDVITIVNDTCSNDFMNQQGDNLIYVMPAGRSR